MEEEITMMKKGREKVEKHTSTTVCHLKQVQNEEMARFPTFLL